MSVFRVNKNENYTVISNFHLRDKTLSLKGKGLLSFILSLPDDWNYSEMGLVSCLKESRDGVRSALKELEEHGYLIRTRERKKDGTLSNIVYDVYETPMLGSPMLGSPTLEKTTQINTKVTNRLTELSKENNPLYPPEGERVAEAAPQKRTTRKRETNSEQEERFSQFWKAYPKKKAKQTAERAFLKLKADAALFSQIMEALEKQKQSRQWLKDNGDYTPHAATWLNQRRWEDELETVAAPAQSSVVNGIDWSAFDG